MKKKYNFTEDKLKNLFDNNSYAKFEIPENMENKINNLYPKKTVHIPVYRRKAFLSIAAACCVMLTCIAIILPNLSGRINNDDALNEIPLQNEAAGNNAGDIFSEIQIIVNNNFTVSADASSADNDGTYTESIDRKIVFNSTVAFTAVPQDFSAKYLESICGSGNLQVSIAQFGL